MAGENRNIPAAVRRSLRQEVGFGCPVQGCGNPYLTYHHFDPEWHIEHHHDPPRMIALCQQHHDKAGVGTFSVEQLREMKATAQQRQGDVAGRFDWMKRDLLVIAGGNAYYENTYAIVLGDEPLLWFNRDEQRHQLLNIRMPLGPDGEERTSLVDNDWVLRGDPVDVTSRPSGDELKIVYQNGDTLSVKFRSMEEEALLTTYPYASSLSNERHLPDPLPPWLDESRLPRTEKTEFPITTVEVNLTLKSPTGMSLELTPNGMWIGGRQGFHMTRCMFSHNRVGVSIG